MREFSGEFFIIQQNNAPAHGACKTVNCLEWKTFRNNFVNYTTPNNTDMTYLNSGRSAQQRD